MIIFAIILQLITSILCTSDDYNGPWRTAIIGEGTCWHDPNCNRAMTTAHGGEWTLQYPYDSLPAFQQAAAHGADAVKGDFRVSLDGVGMVMHSSPIEIYESFDCYGKHVEEMTAAECQQCHMINTQYTFISVPSLLEWAADVVNVMLCVKRKQDFPRAIATLLENNASSRAFLEIHVQDFLDLETSDVPKWAQVFYVVELSGPGDVDTLLSYSEALLSRALLAEFNSLENWGWPHQQDTIAADIERVEQRGIRSFVKSNGDRVTATVANHLRLYKAGFDVVYTYNLTNAVSARIEVNKVRGLDPA